MGSFRAQTVGEQVADLSRRMSAGESRAKTATGQAAVTCAQWYPAEYREWPKVDWFYWDDVCIVPVRRWQSHLLLSLAATTSTSDTTGQVQWTVDGYAVDASLVDVDADVLRTTVLVEMPAGPRYGLVDVRLRARLSGSSASGSLYAVPTEVTPGPADLVTAEASGTSDARVFGVREASPSSRRRGDGGGSYGSSPRVPPVQVVSVVSTPKPSRPAGS